MPVWQQFVAAPDIAFHLVGWPQTTAGIATVCAIALSIPIMGLLWRKKPVDYQGKHVIVTGGSQGLGLCVAQQLVKRGAHVTIMARTVATLQEAVKQIQPPSADQKVAYVAVDLRDHLQVERAFDEACKPFDNKSPDHVIATAGAASNLYGFFNELSPEQFKLGWEINYLTVLWTTREAARRMARDGIQGHITVTSSIAGLLGYACSSAYTPAKAAIRGLTDCLRNEFNLFGIQIHAYFPGGIDSPGFVSEQIGKPDLAKRIEEDDVHLDPNVCARGLLKGIDRGHYMITTDFVGRVVVAGVRGPGPRNSLLDWGYDVISGVGLPIWRIQTDARVRNGTPDSKAHVERVRNGVVKSP